MRDYYQIMKKNLMVEGSHLDAVTFCLPEFKHEARRRWEDFDEHPQIPTYELTVSAEGEGLTLTLEYDEEDTDLPEFVWASVDTCLRKRDLSRHAVEVVPSVVGTEARYAHLPCATVDGPAFREQLWMQTGADVDGEIAQFKCHACGGQHCVTLVDRGRT